MVDVKVLGDDFDLNDVADLPEFKPFPTGNLIVHFPEGLVRKKVGEHDAVELKMVYKAGDELKLDDGQEPPKEGDICSTLFILGNEMGQGNLKEIMKPMAEAAGFSGFKALCEWSKGKDAAVIGVQTKNKEGKKFFNIKMLRMI